MRIVALFIVSILLCVGCRPGGERDPFDSAHSTVVEGVSAGDRATRALESIPFRARYNPAPCDCPPYEIYAYGRWTRVFLDASEVRGQVESLRAEDPLAVTTVEGQLGREVRSAGNGVRYPVLSR